MIFNNLALVLHDLLIFMIGLFPNADSGVLSSFNSQMSGFRSMIAQASWIFPVNWLFYFLGLIIVIEVSLFGYRIVKLLVGYISGGLLRD